MTTVSTLGSEAFLADLVRKTYELYCEQQARINQQQLQQEQKRSEQLNYLARQTIASFQAAFDFEFESELLHQLKPAYSIDGEAAKAILCYAGIRWDISQREGSPTWQWNLQASLEGEPTRLYSNLSVVVERLSLSKMVLLLFVMAEQQRADEQEQLARKQREGLQREAEKQQAIEAARQEDEALRQELEVLRDKTAREMWRWPEEWSLSLYRCVYPVVKDCDAYGRLVYEQDDGWSIKDQPDPSGYIRLEETCDYTTQEVKVDPSDCPLWFRHRITSTEELPECLRQEVYVGLPDVVQREDPLDGVLRLKRVSPEKMHYGEKPCRLEVGSVPLPWIQRLVDQQVDVSA